MFWLYFCQSIILQGSALFPFLCTVGHHIDRRLFILTQQAARSSRAFEVKIELDTTVGPVDTCCVACKGKGKGTGQRVQAHIV